MANFLANDRIAAGLGTMLRSMIPERLCDNAEMGIGGLPVIDPNHLLMYRNDMVRDLRDRQKQNLRDMLDLQTKLAEFKLAEPQIGQALARADMLPLDVTKCPRCFIADGKSVDLIAVDRPNGADPDSDYFRCAEKCGFDNFP